MRKIYVSLDALLIPSEKPDPHVGTGIAPYAQAFLTWASTQGRTVLLTDRPLPYAARVLKTIGCEDKIPIRGFEVSKTELLDHKDDFYLVDDMLIPGELSWFSEHGLSDRLVAVSPYKGPTPETKAALEEKFRKPHK